jgi:hypothetical protein
MADPGVRTTDTITVPIANESRRAAIVREVTAHPSVFAVAAEGPPMQAEASVFAEATADKQAGESADMRRSVSIDYKFVSPEYFQLLDIDLMRGRGFTDAERTADAGVTVVSESTARRLWPNGEASGRSSAFRQIVRQTCSGPAPHRLVPAPTPSSALHEMCGRAIFQFFAFSGVLPIDPQRPGLRSCCVSAIPNKRASLCSIALCGSIRPDHEVVTLRTRAGMGAYILQIVFCDGRLGGLALALTVSGLFSILSYLVEQRAKEIGVRIALGATTQNIVALVLSQSARPVGFGLLAGGGLAAGLAIVLMSTLGSESGNTVRVFDPMAYAASLLVIVIACVLAASVPALRAARVDPIATLRND